MEKTKNPEIKAPKIQYISSATKIKKQQGRFTKLKK